MISGGGCVGCGFVPGDCVLTFAVKDGRAGRSRLFGECSRGCGLPMCGVVLGAFGPGKVSGIVPKTGPCRFVSLVSGTTFIVAGSFRKATFSLGLGAPFIRVPMRKGGREVRRLLRLIG